MTRATWLLAHARATARTAFGLPIASAIVLIGTRRAAGNTPQLFPNLPLKRSCLDVERQIGVRSLAGDQSEHFIQPEV